MKSGLNSKTVLGQDLFEEIIVNVFDINTKTIVFTGNTLKVGAFLGVNSLTVHSYLRSKARFRKTYALRVAKNK